ncbi:MAG: hypothetical protein LEGION0403_FIIPPAGN_02403 [Legionella sp.]|uniref:zincin-like metallopeptidase domain-containing protein n=1 Tax=Legionella sp. TaxID=459 RepID=UPI003D0DB35C
MDKIPYHQNVANKIIEQLKQGTAPWLKPWNPGVPGGQLPMNPVTGKRYKGINALILMQADTPDNRWLTYNQAQSIGAQVRKGEKGTLVQYWKFSEEHIQKDELGQPSLNEEGKPIKITVKLERPQVFYATVFNASQIEGMPPMILKEPEWSPLERAESILAQSGATIIHSEMDRAFYRIISDEIHLPMKSQFKESALYYATALHELGHWTGHESRLNRDLGHPFGSEGYAKEELRAEIASMMLGDELGIGHDPAQHTAYIKSWIRVLEEDPMEIFRAASDAEKISNHLHSLVQIQEQTVYQQTESREDSRVTDEPMNSINALADKIWLAIPYHQKDTVKSIAGVLSNGDPAITWDKETKKWYAREGANLELLTPWLESKTVLSEQNLNVVAEKTWLAIPFDQKDTAKSIIGTLPDGTSGIAWDKAHKCWFAKPGVSLEKIKCWIPDNKVAAQQPVLSPIDEFKDVLISMGFVVTGHHPLMDGKKHRIEAEGDKKGEKAGFYVGHLDGLPAGYIKNNRTGQEMRWKSKGYVLSDEDKAILKATALEKIKTREAELEALHQNTAMQLKQKLSRLQELSSTTPYLNSKGIEIHPGVFTDEEKNTLFVPAFDKNGDIWTMQYIKEDGTKRFAKDSRKEGCFHVVGGMENLSLAPAIVIAEGYATAATLKQVLDFPVVSAFDAGNLKTVAQGLKERFPDKPILIAGDDDKHLETTKKPCNPGKEKALEAASSVDGHVIFPIFAPDEQEGNPKKFSDFNDLAQNSHLGFEGVQRQIKPVVKKIIQKQQGIKQTTAKTRVHPL